VAAVRGGYTVIAIDAFADRQTVECAKRTAVVDFDAQGFVAEALLKVIAQLDLSDCLGCVYGSGFEAQPNLLQKIAEVIPLIGNKPVTVGEIKHKAQFFSVLRRLGVAHPAVFDVLPEADESNKSAVYLKKFAAGSGGSHIGFARTNDAKLVNKKLSANEYYQQQIDGQSVSLLFLADGHEIEVIGFNELWLSSCDATPFRYGGAVSHIELPNGVQQQLIEAAKKLTLAFDLLGLNSIDAIVQGDKIYVLEVNPRLSATVDLYDNAVMNLIDRHVQVCLSQAGLNQECFGCTSQNQQYRAQEIQVKKHKAHAVVYLASDMETMPVIEWPDWVVDTPFHLDETQRVLTGHPICTVIAYGDSAEAAKRTVFARVTVVEKLLNINTESHNKKAKIVEKV
jgi:uncharacterized protein